MPVRPPSGTRKTPKPRRSGKSSGLRGLSIAKKVLLAGALVLVLGATGVFVYFYVRFSRVIDARLSGEIFDNTSLVFSAPAKIRVGQEGSAEEFAARLRKALYAQGSAESPVGTYALS